MFFIATIALDPSDPTQDFDPAAGQEFETFSSSNTQAARRICVVFLATKTGPRNCCLLTATTVPDGTSCSSFTRTPMEAWTLSHRPTP
jgi:hypothetical protein